jgi:hypothetical protein
MKAAMVEITRNHLFRVFFALLTISSLGSSVWAHEQIGTFSQIKPPTVRPISFAPAEQVGALQPMESSGGGDVRTAVPRVTPSNADASDGGSNPEPRFFLIIGSVLIGIRLIISYWSRKLRKLAAETH